jgi:hypothetical protein
MNNDTVQLSIKVEHFDRKVIEHCLNGEKYFDLFEEIRDQVFRPARKHGYCDIAINDALHKCGGNGEELIGELESKFFDVISEAGVQL